MGDAAVALLPPDGEADSLFAVLPPEALHVIMSHFTSIRDHTRASQVCRRWRAAAEVAVRGRRFLSLSKTKAGDEQLERFAIPAPHLVELDLWGCRITDDGLRLLAGAECMPVLRSLSLWGATKVSDEGLVPLLERGCSLETINLGGTPITDMTLEAIGRCCPRVRDVNLWGCRGVSRGGVVALAAVAQHLFDLNVWGTAVDEQVMGELARLRPSMSVKPWVARERVEYRLRDQRAALEPEASPPEAVTPA